MNGDPGFASDAMALIGASGRRFPVGFEGELMKMARVLSAIFAVMVSGLYWKPSSSLTATVTGTPSRNLIKLG